MDAVTIVGIAGNITSVAMFIPNAKVVWNSRKDKHALQGASIGMQVLLLCNAALWGLYALWTGAYWAAVPGLFNAPLAVFVIWLILRGRGGAPTQQRTDGKCICGWYSPYDDHILLCTSPPGFNTPRECDRVSMVPDYVASRRGMRLQVPSR